MPTTCTVIFFFNLASQMWCLGRLLPLLIGIDVPAEDQHWECFLLLMTIVDYVFAPVTSMDVLDYVKELIETHHLLFQRSVLHFSCDS